MYTWSNTPLVLLFESTQIDHSMDKGAVFIVKCLQAFCIVVAAEIGIFQIVQVTADPPDQLVREDRIKVRTDVCMIAPRILQDQLITIVENGEMYHLLFVD